MADIYNREPSPVGGVFQAEKAIMTISGAGELGVGALVQNVTASYQQQFTPFFELGSNKLYQLMGRPIGTLSIGRIVGSGEFAEAMFDACKGGVTVSFSGGSGFCAGADNSKFNRTLTGVFVTNYTFTMSTQELMIRENIEATFASMSKG